MSASRGNTRPPISNQAPSCLCLVHGVTQQSLVYGKDFVTYGETAEPDINVSGELVFAGDGVTAQSHGIMRTGV